MALFAIVGGLAVDCVKQDHPEYLSKLVESLSDVVEDELATWINDNGGWVCVQRNNNHNFLLSHLKIRPTCYSEKKYF